MKTVAALSLFIASAAAFAPAQQSARSSSLAAFESELGVQPPLGFWDPLNMLDGADQERFDRLRYVEIKHGRICMLAVSGYLTNAAGIHLPGQIAYDGTKFSDLGFGWDASFAVPVAGALQVLAFVGFLELFVMKDKGNGEFPGDLRNGMFKWVGSDEELMKKRAIELNNGRAAQMGILGLMVHDKLGNLEYILPLN